MSTYKYLDPRKTDMTALLAEADASPAGMAILGTCLGLARFLIGKNQAYGNSALEPVRIFSNANTTEQIRVRIDDKLSRLQRGEMGGEDAALDLMGYLVLLRVAHERTHKQ
jgi:hypothetical protein